MVLAFNNGGDFAKAVYGDSSSQHAGANGAIATTNPSATAPVAMSGGKRKRRSQRQNQRQSQRQNQRQSQRQNQRQSQRQNGGKNKRRSQRRNQRQSQRQRGGK